MNYAWSNPSTGIREQTTHSTPERMLAEAKLRVWEEIEAAYLERAETIMYWPIYRREPIGEVTVNGFSLNEAKARELEGDEFNFAWTDPETGKREVAAHFAVWTDGIVEALKRLQENRDSKTSVIIYATWPECTVSRSDPRPAEVPPEEPLESDDTRAGDSPDIAARKQELEEVIVLDDSVKLAKITAWALLDIAMTIREMSVDARYPLLPMRPTLQLGAWERFKRWLLGDPEEDDPEYYAAMRQACKETEENHIHTWEPVKVDVNRPDTLLMQACECGASRTFKGPLYGWEENQ